MTAWKLAGGDGTQEEKDSCRAGRRGGGCEGCSIIYPTLPSAQLLMEDKKKQNVYESRLRYIGWFLVFLLRCTIVFWYEFRLEVLEKQETLSGGLEWSALDLEIAC